MIMLSGDENDRTAEDMIDLANCMGFTISDDNKETYCKWIEFMGESHAENELKRFKEHYSDMLWLFTLTDDELNHIRNKKYGTVVAHRRSAYDELDGYSIVDASDGSSTYKFFTFFNLNEDEGFTTDEDDLEEEIQREFFIKLVDASDPRRVYSNDDRSDDLINRLPTKVEVIMKNRSYIYGIAGSNRVIKVD